MATSSDAGSARLTRVYSDLPARRNARKALSASQQQLPPARKIVRFGPTTVNSFVRPSREAEFIEIIQVTSGTPLKIAGNNSPSSDDDESEYGGDEERKWAFLAQDEVVVMEKEENPYFSVIDGTLVLSKMSLTTSVLNMPAAFYYGDGIVVALLAQLLIMLLSIPGLFILPKFAEDVQAPNDHDLYAAFGLLWHIAGSFVVTWTTMRSNVINLVLAGNQLEHVFMELSGRANYCVDWYMNRCFLIPTAAFLFAFPHIFHRGICFFKYLSYIGMASLSYVTAVIVVHFWVAGEDRGAVAILPKQVHGVVFALPIFVTAYMCHISAVPVYRMLDPEDREKNWKIVVGFSLGISTVLHVTIGVFGYLTFGNKVQSDVFNGYDFSKPVIFVAALGVLVANLLSYPMYLYCGRDALMRLIFIAKGLLVKDRSYFFANSLARVHSRMRCVVSILYFVITVVAATIQKPLNSFLSPNAAANSLFMFFFPGVVLVKGYGRACWLRACGIILIVVGLVIFVTVVTTTVYLWLASIGVVQTHFQEFQNGDSLCYKNRTGFFLARQRN